MQDPSAQTIDTICDRTLPTLVRLFSTRRIDGATNYPYYLGFIEQKVEEANQALACLDPSLRPGYRQKIDAAYTAALDRLWVEVTVPPKIRAT